MKIRVDIGIASLSKKEEEVCGDTSRIIEGKDSVTIILSDGLGSGIKASILSILSTQIAAGLLKRKLGLEQVFATIADTLPICKVRDIAYSTLSILKINYDGTAHLIEYDNPALILVRDNQLLKINKQQKMIAGKEVFESFFRIDVNDLLILVSDGVINAGVGGLFKLGLGRERLLENIFKRDLNNESAQAVTDKIIALTEACYLGKAGDDSTSIAIKGRIPRKVVLLTGPPADQKLDKIVVENFTGIQSWKKIVCGGATGNMLSRQTGRELEISLEYTDPSVPPVASIAGIDLVTEGILTLNKALERLQLYLEGNGLKKADDGASQLAQNLYLADEITFLMGTSTNPAHKEMMESLQLKPRPVVVGHLVNVLRDMGKEVNIETY